MVLKKLSHLAIKKLSKPEVKRTILRRSSVVRNLDKNALKKDIKHLFSLGLLRSSDEIKSDIRKVPIDVADKIIKEAQRLLDKEVTIYGHLKLQFGTDQFSWLRDPLTGFEWPQILTRTQLINSKPYGTDIKTIWEIARFQFLSPLAQAYILTGEEQYARFAVDKVNSWIDENHFPYGPHWTVAMESSIRLINWCVYLPLLNNFKYADLSFENKITQSMLEHLIYIRENLEVSPSTAGNHYLANIVGLLSARLIFPSLSWAVQISKFAEKEFTREVHRQFKNSGINFEGSLPYHRLSSEMCLIGVALIKKSEGQIAHGIVERLRKIANFTKYYVDTCEECPTIGDNDNGIFVKFFDGQELNRHQYLKYLFDCILDDKSDLENTNAFLCSVHFTTPDRTYNSDINQLDEDDNLDSQVKDFNGLIIARHKSEALFFNTLHSSEGHTHNDKLSIYPIIGKKPLFIDHGSFSYTGFIEKRHENRRTSSHNGPVINGWEQNRIWKNDLFYVNGEAKCNTFIDSSDVVVSITGCHYGYRRYSPGMRVFRKVKWNTIERNLLITDWVESKNIHKDMLFTWYFLLNPDWTGVMENNILVLTNEEQKVYFEDSDCIGFTLGQGLYCSNYQVESSSQALTASMKARPGKKFNFLLRY